MFSCVFSRFSQSSARWRTAARAQRQRGCTRGCPDIDRLCLLCKKPTQNIATTELMRRRYRWHRVPDSQRRSPQPAVASDSLARRLTVPPPPTSPHPTYPTRPQNQLAQAARAWQRPQNALPSVESARTPRRVRGSHKLCPSPLPSHDPSVRFRVRHMHIHPCSSFPKPSLLERRGRGSAPNSMSPRVGGGRL